MEGLQRAENPTQEYPKVSSETLMGEGMALRAAFGRSAASSLSEWAGRLGSVSGWLPSAFEEIPSRDDLLKLRLQRPSVPT